MIIGIDIGGTKIEGVLWNTRARQVLRAIRYPTPNTKDKFIKILKLILEQLSKNSRVTGVGVGIPGSFDYGRKKILLTANISYLKDFNITSRIRESIRTRVAVDNDVNCMARAELRLQSSPPVGRRIKNKTVFVIAPGTGIGGAIIFNGQVFKGATNSAGEIGHTILISKFPKRIITLEQLYKVSRDKKDYKKVGVLLGIAITNIIGILNPDMILIGGGLSDIHKKFMPDVRKVVEKFVFNTFAKKTPIKIIRRKQSAAIGAALLFK